MGIFRHKSNHKSSEYKVYERYLRVQKLFLKNEGKIDSKTMFICAKILVLEFIDNFLKILDEY